MMRTGIGIAGVVLSFVCGCGGDSFAGPDNSAGGAGGASAGPMGGGGDSSGGGAGAGGSSATPVNAAGMYSINITSTEQNGCGFNNWKPGTSSMNIPFEITQSGSQATGMLSGGTATLFDIWLGSGAHTFDGTVSGNMITLAAHGTNQTKMMNCSFTLTATVRATVTGDTVEGTLDYTPLTNGSPDCAMVEGCVTRQTLSGARPPM